MAPKNGKPVWLFAPQSESSLYLRNWDIVVLGLLQTVTFNSVRYCLNFGLPCSSLIPKPGEVKISGVGYHLLEDPFCQEWAFCVQNPFKPKPVIYKALWKERSEEKVTFVPDVDWGALTPRIYVGAIDYNCQLARETGRLCVNPRLRITLSTEENTEIEGIVRARDAVYDFWGKRLVDTRQLRIAKGEDVIYGIKELDENKEIRVGACLYPTGDGFFWIKSVPVSRQTIAGYRFKEYRNNILCLSPEHEPAEVREIARKLICFFGRELVKAEEVVILSGRKHRSSRL
ncbi:MAG: hypothetical protein M1514_03915 [Patescibacteria group bacterium]|nr:hypothetical protein [Patescibacteria group bacterium]